MPPSSNGPSRVSSPPSSSVIPNDPRTQQNIASMATKSVVDGQRKQNSSPMDQTQRYVLSTIPFHPCFSLLLFSVSSLLVFHLFTSLPSECLNCPFAIIGASCVPRYPKTAPSPILFLSLHYFTTPQDYLILTCNRKPPAVPAWSKGSTNPVTNRPSGGATTNGVTTSSNRSVSSNSQRNSSNNAKDSSMAYSNPDDRMVFLLQNAKVGPKLSPLTDSSFTH